MDLKVIMGIVLVLMETIICCLLVCDGFCWLDVKSYGKMPKHITKRNFVMVLLEKANGL